MLRFIFQVFALFVSFHQASAYTEIQLTPNTPIAFDAESSEINLEKELYWLRGDAFLMIRGSVVSSEDLYIDKKQGIIEARGNVVLVVQENVFIGGTLRYSINNGHFKMSQARFTMADQDFAQLQAKKSWVIRLRSRLMSALRWYVSRKLNQQRRKLLVNITKICPNLRLKYY